jgi:CheY-like chemotaxis protein
LVRFLLVEDDDSHVAILRRNLERSRVGNAIDRVADGAAALEFLRREGVYADRMRPDVILLDLKLPKLDGHEVLAAIKSDPNLQDIPVVVLTTSNAELDRVKAYRHHTNSYLVKPIDFEQFCKMVDDLGIYWGVWNRPPPAKTDD